MSLPQELVDRKAKLLATLIRARVGSSVRRALVVGCGSGVEAAVLAQVLDAEVVGIDLNTSFDASAQQFARLQWGDATSLQFHDGEFDLVYSYHALEHIPNHRKALQEMKRVLKEGGWFCIGVPNRARLIGYLGADDTSISEKLRWNLADWKAKLTGKFRNELGAHAGFTLAELTQDVTSEIAEAEDITLRYYLSVYARYGWIVRALAMTGLGTLLFPAIYLLGHKPPVAVR